MAEVSEIYSALSHIRENQEERTPQESVQSYTDVKTGMKTELRPFKLKSHSRDLPV